MRNNCGGPRAALIECVAKEISREKHSRVIQTQPTRNSFIIGRVAVSMLSTFDVSSIAADRITNHMRPMQLISSRAGQSEQFRWASNRCPALALQMQAECVAGSIRCESTKFRCKRARTMCRIWNMSFITFRYFALNQSEKSDKPATLICVCVCSGFFFLLSVTVSVDFCCSTNNQVCYVLDIIYCLFIFVYMYLYHY